MRKIIFLIALVLPICTYATDMCARDDTMVLVLDKSASCPGYSSNQQEWIWSKTCQYGRIAGDATCLSLNEGLGQTRQGAYYGAGEYANTLITTKSGLSGQDVDGNERKYCWCRMTHPLMSVWVLYGTTPSACNNVCAQYCAVLAQAVMVSGWFDSIGL